MIKVKTRSNQTGQKLAQKTLREISQPDQPQCQSRSWQDPEGYRFLVAWSNAVLLRFLIRLFTDFLPKSEYRRKAQVDDAARSVVRNIEEGYKRATTSEYLQFIGYSQGSLEEVKGDVREMTEDGFLKSRPGSGLAGLGINLGDFNQALRGNKGTSRKLEDIKGKVKESKGGYNQAESSKFIYRPLISLYPPLKILKPQDLTIEIFMELINKTDWNLRKLVWSLEKKLAADQKGYQIEKARMRSNLKFK